MRRFGEHLIERRILTPVQLDEALQSQVAFGARLGTNLVELGHLEMQVLAAELSSFVRAPIPPRAWIETIDRATLRSVPLHLVKQHKVLPLQSEDGTLHVAMLDPTNPVQLEQLSSATGAQICPYVLPEASMYFWLERHYGMPRPVRYLNIGRATADRFPESILAEPQPLAEEQSLADVFDWRSLADEPPVVDADPAAPAPERHSVVAARLEAELLEACDRDAIISTALELAQLYGSTVALFLVHQQLLQGLRSGSTAARVEWLVLPLQVQSILTAPAVSGEPFRGAPESEQDIRLLRAIGRTDVREVAVLPIKIRARVVNVLYVDNGTEPLSSTSYAALLALTECVAAAYERLILERKKESG